MPRQVQISYAVPEPGPYLRLYGVVDGTPMQISVLRAEYDAQPNIGAKRLYVAGKLAAALDSFLGSTEPGLPGIITIQAGGGAPP